MIELTSDAAEVLGLGTLLSIGTENASETRFQVPKLDHANAPIMLVVHNTNTVNRTSPL